MTNMKKWSLDQFVNENLSKDLTYKCELLKSIKLISLLIKLCDYSCKPVTKQNKFCQV